MIEFFSETNFEGVNEPLIDAWIKDVILSYDKVLGELVYVFCNDDYLYNLNVSFLKHNTLTDIISFDNSMGNIINGEIYISIDRVKENALDYHTTFFEELYRVIIHGVLHFCGLKDKTESEANKMRAAENKALTLLRY